jgi:tetratricopeptide (TPR) repeat protein
VALIALLALVAVTPPALAEGERERATALFRRGSALFSKGKYERALELLEQAKRLYPSHKIEVSIGYTLAELGRLPEAAQSFERFLSDPASLKSPEVVDEVLHKLGRLKRSLSRLKLSGHAPADTISIDGAPAPSPLPSPLYLRPGGHRLAVVRGGQTILEQSLTLDAGELRLLTVGEAAPALLTTAPTRARPSARRTTPIYKRWWLWTIGGAVLSAVVIGTVAATSGGSDRLPSGSLGTMDLRK